MSEPLVAVTGTGSEIGKAIVSELKSRGYSVLALTRKNSEIGQEFDLNSSSPIDYPHSCVALIHVAWDWEEHPSKALELNVRNASEKIFELKRHEIKTVLLSTMSVYSKDVSNYGKAKFQLENTFLTHSGSIVRAGIVFGGADRGILAQIKKISRLPICVHLGTHKGFYFSDLAGLAEVIVDRVSEPHPTVFEYRTHKEFSLHEILNLINPSNKRIHVKVGPLALRSIVKSLSVFARILPFRPDSLSALLPVRDSSIGQNFQIIEARVPSSL
jgi:dTDP-4-dehydrorhamnose reductase